jgi:hypothetical protein
VLKDSFGLATILMSEDHIETIYFNETSFTAIHDTLLNPVDQTAMIFGNSRGGTDVTNCTNQLVILESLLAGGGCTLYPCAHAAQAGASHLQVEGNHFARCLTAEGYEPNGGTHPCVGGPDAGGYFKKSGSYGVAFNYFAPAASGGATSGTTTSRGSASTAAAAAANEVDRGETRPGPHQRRPRSAPVPMNPGSMFVVRSPTGVPVAPLQPSHRRTT